MQPNVHSSTGSGGTRRLCALLVACAVLCLAVPACGVGGAGEAGSPLVLLTFHQDGVDNSVLNARLEFQFSDDLNPATVNAASFQIREGPSFGATVAGSFDVSGSRVIFEPRLAGLCDHSDSGLKPGTRYSVQLVGEPEEFAIHSVSGRPLGATRSFEFATRSESAPSLYDDQIPGVGPAVRAAVTSPLHGEEAVAVALGNRVVLPLTENVNPCTVGDATVLIHVYEFGGVGVQAPTASGRISGFSHDGTNTGLTADQVPGVPFTWGAVGTTTLSVPQRLLAHISLTQSFAGTTIDVTPTAGRFPDNALIVVRLTFGIRDFGGTPLVPFALAFTTENLPPQSSTYVLENAGETPYDVGATSADVNTARAPGLVQGYLLFAGDGDNGTNQLSPTLPQSDPGSCTLDFQVNDGTQDDFEATADVLLDSGATSNSCANATDGSLAVVWEFNTFRVRNGATVRCIGINPVVLLVQGDVVIENGARLLCRGDGLGGSPVGAGEGNKNATTVAGAEGGTGVCGGGNGGASPANNATAARKGGDGIQGYFHTTPTSGPDPSVGMAGGTGGGHGNMSAHWTAQTNPNNRNSASGGGGGHAASGTDGAALGTGTAPTSQDTPLDGVGGAEYGDDAGRMPRAEAGSGGGAGGEVRAFTGNVGRGPGGGGGAGGGFLDLTCGGDMTILGTIDAAGSAGGSHPGGVFNPNYAYQPGVGGGGGGSGGGIRLLTPNEMVFAATTVVTAAGGPGGAGGASQGVGAPLNDGGAGAAGRICLENRNSVITNLGAAMVVPGEGNAGFYRGIFDPTRFQGGGLSPSAVTEVFAVGPFNPVYLVPVQSYGGTEDFVAGIPAATSPGAGKTAILIEVQGFQMLPDATPQPGSATGWYTVGHFTDAGVDSLPAWHATTPNASQLPQGVPADNVGTGIANIAGSEFVQIRITFFLGGTSGATDPGPFVDRWRIRFTHNQ